MGRSKIYGVASAAVGAGSVGPAATKSVIPSTANELPGTKSSGKPRKIHTAKAQAATRPLDPPLSPPPSSPLGFDNPHEGEICGFDASPDSPVASEATLAASEPGSPPPISVIVSKAASGSIKKKSRSKDRKGKENENVIVVDVKLEAIKEVAMINEPNPASPISPSTPPPSSTAAIPIIPQAPVKQKRKSLPTEDPISPSPPPKPKKIKSSGPAPEAAAEASNPTSSSIPTASRSEPVNPRIVIKLRPIGRPRNDGTRCFIPVLCTSVGSRERETRCTPQEARTYGVMCDDEGKVVGREGGEIVWRVLQEGDGGRPKKKKVPVVDEGVQPAELQQEIEMQPSEVPVYDIVGIEEYSEDEAEGDEWRDMPRTPARTPGRTPCRTLNWDAIAAIHAASFPKPDFQTVDLARSQQRLLTESQDFCAAFPETEGGLEVQASELDLPLSIDMNCEIAGLHELDAEQLRQVLAAAPATPSFTAPFATPPSRKQPLPSPAVSPCRGFEDLIDLSMFESPPRLRSPIRLATAPATPHPPVPTTPARVLFEHPERHPSVQWSPLFAGIGAEKDDDWEPRRNKIRV